MVLPFALIVLALFAELCFGDVLSAETRKTILDRALSLRSVMTASPARDAATAANTEDNQQTAGAADEAGGLEFVTVVLEESRAGGPSPEGAGEDATNLVQPIAAQDISIFGVLCGGGQQSQLEDTTTTAAARTHADILKQKDEEIAWLREENTNQRKEVARLSEDNTNQRKEVARLSEENRCVAGIRDSQLEINRPVRR